MLTIIFIIILIIILIKCFGPLLIDLFKFCFSLLSLPFTFIGGILGFLIDAILFLGLLWLLAFLFGT